MWVSQRFLAPEQAPRQTYMCIASHAPIHPHHVCAHPAYIDGKIYCADCAPVPTGQSDT